MKPILLITGASDGIGAATALLAAQEQYTVCVNYRQNEQAAQAIVAQIQAAGGEAYAFQADVSVEQEVNRMFEKIDQQVGRLTALVNNAGILQVQQPLVDITAQRLQEIFATNVFGSCYCAREAVKRMSTTFGGPGGSIVNVSSIAAKYGGAFEYVDYAASKGAVDAMTIGLAKEVADQQIRVNAVRPGLIHTKIHASGGEPNRIERLKGQIPMKRGGDADEVARTILWLLSSDASYITGALLDVAGGR